MTFALKLALVPLVIWLASLAGRRWGHAATGWISGLPLIAGPIIAFLVLDYGAVFAGDIAIATLTVMPASAIHCLMFALASRRFGWATSLLAALCGFMVASLILERLDVPPVIALVLALIQLALILMLMPRGAHGGGAVVIPRVEIIVRMAFAAALAGALTLGAPMFGPRTSGLLLSVPITGTVLPAFTLALYGRDATLRLLRGFVSGLASFAAFFFVLAAGLPRFDILSTFGLAIAAALATSTLWMRLRR